MKTNGVVVFILVLTGLVFAQPQFQFGADFSVGVPQNDFKDNIENNGYGLKGHFAYNFSNTPFWVGGQLGFLIYGHETRKEPFSSTIPEVTVDVSTSYSILLTHLMMRVQSPVGSVRPYLDGLVGLNYFSTSTDINSEEWVDDDHDNRIASSTNQSDMAFSYGGGGGIVFRVWREMDKDKKSSLAAVFIDVQAHYIRGSEAEYLKKGSRWVDDNNQVQWKVYKSTTDLINFNVGVSLAF